MTKEEVEKGLVDWKYERTVLRRLLKRGPMTEDKFDEIFAPHKRITLPSGETVCVKRKHKYKTRSCDGFLFGFSCINGGTIWAEYLELLQCMCQIGEVKTHTDKDTIVYTLTKD